MSEFKADINLDFAVDLITDGVETTLTSISNGDMKSKIEVSLHLKFKLHYINI